MLNKTVVVHWELILKVTLWIHQWIFVPVLCCGSWSLVDSSAGCLGLALETE